MIRCTAKERTSSARWSNAVSQPASTFTGSTTPAPRVGDWFWGTNSPTRYWNADTGEFVGRSGGNLDHVIPRDRGGRDSFENLVWSKKEINSLKANRLPHEAGLHLMRKPKAPKPLPVSATVREARHPDWRHFLHN